MVENYILSIDEGTTSTRAIIFDHQGQKVVDAQREIPQNFPNPGWVEHDANEIWDAVLSTIADALIKSRIRPSQLKELELLTSGKPQSFGIRKQGCQFIMRSFGNHGKRQILPMN